MEKSAVQFLVIKLEELMLKNDFNEISDEEYLKEKENILIISKHKEKENMINFLKSVFQQENFDYEKAYNDFLKQK
jgi:hypothetical protein